MRGPRVCALARFTGTSVRTRTGSSTCIPDNYDNDCLDIARGPDQVWHIGTVRIDNGMAEVGDRLVAHRQRRRADGIVFLARTPRAARDHRGTRAAASAASLVRARSAHRPRLHGRDAHLEDADGEEAHGFYYAPVNPEVRRSPRANCPAHRPSVRGPTEAARPGLQVRSSTGPRGAS